MKTETIIEKLKDLLTENWPTIVDKYNNHISKNFQLLYLQDFKSYFYNKKTEEKTKIVSPIFNAVLCEYLKEFEFYRNEINGADYLFENLDLEGKLTIGDTNYWTGNGFKKTNWHILKKITLNENGTINKSSCYLLPVDECKSGWTSPVKTSNFSNLKINSEDFHKLVIVHGGVDLHRKRKYIQPVLK